MGSSPNPRVAGALAACGLLFAGIVGAFWYQDWRYSLPTPKPANLRQPPLGAVVPVSSELRRGEIPADAPLLLHFFNPNCPCSRFNLAHVRELSARYAGRVTMRMVLEGAGEPERLTLAFDALDLPFEGIADGGGEIAAALGVYSTPQAVLLDGAGRLLYRGNYNASRYCADQATEYVRIALDSLLAESGGAPFTTASAPYGCPLPTDALAANASRVPF